MAIGKVLFLDLTSQNEKTLAMLKALGSETRLAILAYLGERTVNVYEPDHIHAQLLWLGNGYVSYRFPNHLPHGAVPVSLDVSVEMCSEAPLHHLNWPSDITLWINDIEIGTWTSPADFGGKRGLLTPEWWETKDTQYGQLKIWSVNSEGSFIDGRSIGDIKTQDLGLEQRPYVEVRFGIKPDALNVGGINLFGEKFGNYPQPIVLKVNFAHPNGGARIEQARLNGSQPNALS